MFVNSGSVALWTKMVDEGVLTNYWACVASITEPSPVTVVDATHTQ